MRKDPLLIRRNILKLLKTQSKDFIILSIFQKGRNKLINKDRKIKYLIMEYLKVREFYTNDDDKFVVNEKIRASLIEEFQSPDKGKVMQLIKSILNSFQWKRK